MFKFDLLKIRDLIASMLFASFIIFNASEYSFLSVAILSGFLLVTHYLYVSRTDRNTMTITIQAMHKRMILFDSFCFLSAVWASNSSAALQDGISIIANIICVSIVYLCYQKDDSIERLIKTVMYGGVIISLYVLSYYGLDGFITLVSKAQRLGNDIGNSNAIGFVLAISLIIFIFRFIKNGFSKDLLLAILPLLVLAVSQSRTALLTLGAGILVLLLKNCKNNKENHSARYKTFFLAFMMLIVLWYIVYNTSLFGGINNRMNDLFSGFSGNQISEGSLTERLLYITSGFSVFLRNPIVGLGIGNSSYITQNAIGYTTYLHNNYIELLACGGILGFFCYYSMFIYLIPSKEKYNRRNQESVHNSICVALAIMMLISDIGRVSYYKKETYFLIMILFINTEKNKRKVSANSGSVVFSLY